jgi:hypothetical protein
MKAAATKTDVKDKKTVTQEEIIDLLKKEQGDRSLREFAPIFKVTAGYISDIYNHRRRPGLKVLKYFGIVKKRRVTVDYLFYFNK